MNKIQLPWGIYNMVRKRHKQYLQCHIVFLQNYQQSVLKAQKKKKVTVEEINFEQGFESRSEEIPETSVVVQSSIAKVGLELGLESWLGPRWQEEGWTLLIWEVGVRKGCREGWNNGAHTLREEKLEIRSSDRTCYIKETIGLEKGLMTWYDKGQHFTFLSQGHNIKFCFQPFSGCWVSFRRSSCSWGWLSYVSGSQSIGFHLATCGRGNYDTRLDSEPSLAASPQDMLGLEKDLPSSQKAELGRTRTPNVHVLEKKKVFKPSKMTHHKTEQIRERWRRTKAITVAGAG